jgi:hypothetical protein
MKKLSLVMVLAILSTSFATVGHFEGFEDPAWAADTDAGNWQNYGGTIVRVDSGTNGITSSSGNAHAVMNGAAYTRFGGYSSDFGGGFTASMDVYLDPTWASGTGFDWTVAASRQTGDHLRDFIFHVGVVNGNLLVNASNNSDWQFNSSKLLNNNNGNYYTVNTAGWYTLEHVFRDENGSLAVDLNLLNAAGDLLYSVTRSNAADLIDTVVGGNRYGWAAYNNVPNLALDNVTLVPEPATMVLLGLGGLLCRRFKRA